MRYVDKLVLIRSRKVSLGWRSHCTLPPAHHYEFESSLGIQEKRY